VSGPPQRAVALIGDPVAHSVSPAMHRAAFAAAGLDLGYFPVTVRREELIDAFPRLRRTYLGMNVTAPLKEAVIPLLDTLSPAAARAGSVNTVLFADGGAQGMSTDGEGFVAALWNGLRGGGEGNDGGEFPSGALVLGTGGAARAVAAALLSEGTRVVVCGRNAEAGDRMASDLGVPFVPAHPGALVRELARAELLVNATPVGGPADAGAHPLLDSATLHPGLIVFDLVYRPRRTALLARAEAAGCRTVEGVEMLIEQAARSFEIWTGRPTAPVKVMREAACRALEASPEPRRPLCGSDLGAARPDLAPAVAEERR
jgi:shikimate dehydrogenase